MSIWKRRQPSNKSEKTVQSPALVNHPKSGTHPKSFNSIPKLSNFFVFLILFLVCSLLFLSQTVDAVTISKWEL